MTFYFAPIAEGLGDLLMTLPALEALISTGEPTCLVVRSAKQEGVAECIPGLSGWIKEPDFLNLKLDTKDRYINLRAHPLNLQNVIGSDKFIDEFGKLTIYDVFELISNDYIKRDLSIDWNFRNYSLLQFNARPELAQTILFVPGSAGEFKCWSTDSWIDLYRSLNDLNVPTVVLGKPDNSKACKDLVDAGLPWLKTASFSEALDVVSSAKAMISVDTGLMHLSVQQRKPTIAFFLARSYFVRPEEYCFPIIAKPCIEDCLKWVKAWPTNKPDMASYGEVEFYKCPAIATERCMNSISAVSVFERMKQIGVI